MFLAQDIVIAFNIYDDITKKHLKNLPIFNFLLRLSYKKQQSLIFTMNICMHLITGSNIE